jgi:tetratricopeptide (TPR) repeat protein
MAATPSKASPSQKDAGENHDQANGVTANLKDPLKVKAITPEETIQQHDSSQSLPLDSVSHPTYESSESSRYYTVAKALLAEGDFETALSTIEEGIEATKAALQGDDDTGEGNNDNDTHESLAPFHYLYGSTLLYSVEESTDENQQFTNATTVDVDGNAVAAAGAPENEKDGDEEVDDIQIAWENLELARTIIEKMLETILPQDKKDKLRADLAQVYLRQGDLLRVDSNYETAIASYIQCLKHRENNSTIGPFDRKLADVHYNLGLSYFMQVAETEIPKDETAAEVQTKLNAARSHGFRHYWKCSNIFAAQAVLLCDVDDPLAWIAQAENPITSLKSAGDEHEHEEKIIGAKLQSIRQQLTTLAPPSSEEGQSQLENFMAILDEIQETIDEAENSEKGVHQVTEMKQQIAEAVAAQVQSAEEETGFGSAAAAETTAQAQQPITMMVVKKKKKRNTDEEGEDAPLPPAQQPAKRPKAEAE